jgi:hypothetical protein
MRIEDFSELTVNARDDIGNGDMGDELNDDSGVSVAQQEQQIDLSLMELRYENEFSIAFNFYECYSSESGS